MSKKFQYLDLPNLYYLMEGLTFNVPACADVLNSVFVSLNKKTKIPDKIWEWHQSRSTPRPRLSFPDRGRIIIELIQSFSKERKMLYCAQVLENKEEEETAPVVFFCTHSPTLDIPMRTEVPMRALIKGGPALKGTYSVYVHVLVSDNGNNFTYYGITKRDWNNRFTEHLRSAFQDGTRRLFALKLRELIDARTAQLYGTVTDTPKLKGVITAVCVVGLEEDLAMDIEEYLVDKYSLSSKHPNGMNMIPGGREGIRSLAPAVP